MRAGANKPNPVASRCRADPQRRWPSAVEAHTDECDAFTEGLFYVVHLHGVVLTAVFCVLTLVAWRE